MLFTMLCTSTWQSGREEAEPIGLGHLREKGLLRRCPVSSPYLQGSLYHLPWLLLTFKWHLTLFWVMKLWLFNRYSPNLTRDLARLWVQPSFISKGLHTSVPCLYILIHINRREGPWKMNVLLGSRNLKADKNVWVTTPSVSKFKIDWFWPDWW